MATPGPKTNPHVVKVNTHAKRKKHQPGQNRVTRKKQKTELKSEPETTLEPVTTAKPASTPELETSPELESSSQLESSPVQHKAVQQARMFIRRPGKLRPAAGGKFGKRSPIRTLIHDNLFGGLDDASWSPLAQRMLRRVRKRAVVTPSETPRQKRKTWLYRSLASKQFSPARRAAQERANRRQLRDLGQLWKIKMGLLLARA
ncbi:hypothetical protein LTR86_004270 [Recurvomyces mirabilis]|nr:hypothetical protein LTR86_004270 [Recurvomyces mirabilis]